VDSGFAPAKVNLALHVTGRGADGYHRLDSLVAFTALGDRLTATPAAGLSLAVAGPFAAGVPTDESNLVLRAARALQAARGMRRGAALRLYKALPHAAGLGGGSSDAAATIRLLSALWGVEPIAPDDPAALALGSDVPACLGAPAPQRLGGRGEILAAVALPPCGLVLVNPGARLPTAAVFARLEQPENPPLPPLPDLPTAEALAGWMRRTRNDLEAPARAIAPIVGAALAALARTPGILAATMSGSGATCIGVARDAGRARDAARALQIAHPGWWVAPAPLLRPAGAEDRPQPPPAAGSGRGTAGAQAR
jgi:4-diphosphocytidyl-2-C-methyl-D-erythritol kinase